MLNEIMGLGLFGCLLVVIMMFPFRQRLFMTSLIGLAMALFLMVGYHWVGNGEARRLERLNQARLARAQEILRSFNSVEDVARALKAKLDHQPHSAKGWYLLGRLYDSQGRQEEAAVAYDEANRLNGAVSSSDED